MNLSRIISKMLWWWEKKHPSLRKLPEWNKANTALSHAKRRGCTQDIRRAREEMRKAVYDDLRRV